MNTINPLADVQAKLALATGKVAWGTALGVGSFLTVEFGERVEQAKGKVHGEFHLWVYCSAWRIETPAEIVASSEDPREFLEPTVRSLDGRTLSDIQLDMPSLSSTFAFSDGTRLRTFSIFSKDFDHWMFYLPGGEVFTAGPGSTWSLGR
ncbi:hypothetical protein [Allorhizocola rhizosphaerae]|uniref:hypothetical protein n=1 Tax=Allorhizocola rhizosphaerae TaxID=1872709 RepID=UPI000E3C9CC9|nr:hypothetical protein [Allorhizocola rhizosphaerae]